MAIPVIAIIDIGKTNKKFFLFDQSYRTIFEKTATLRESKDPDGDPCEDLDQLVNFVYETLQEVLLYKYYDLKAINFSAYGASFVCINEKGKPVGPLYNYLKEYPADLLKEFYSTYGGEKEFSVRTASPVLGSLNSGMQLYRMKKERPKEFAETRFALHLPQFLSYLITRTPCTDLTSVGCHTNLWDFTTQQYHHWVKDESLLPKLPVMKRGDDVVPVKYDGHEFVSGIGLHDSSAALIPYLMNFQEPFILLSTGTWSITLNPFNHTTLDNEELEHDCLCYLSFTGTPVKASRLFSGNEYEREVKRISAHYGQSVRHYNSMPYNPDLLKAIDTTDKPLQKESPFAGRDLSAFSSDEVAYHQLMYDLVLQQFQSTNLVLDGSDVKKIFVDGGFSKNQVFMHLLAKFFPDMDVYAASMAQGTALGSALAIHHHWNREPIPGNLISLTHFARQAALC
jgi:sugar (pentulose or hexulose) kinase